MKKAHFSLDESQKQYFWALIYGSTEDWHDLFIVALLSKLEERLYQTQWTPTEKDVCDVCVLLILAAVLDPTVVNPFTH